MCIDLALSYSFFSLTPIYSVPPLPPLPPPPLSSSSALVPRPAKIPNPLSPDSKSRAVTSIDETKRRHTKPINSTATTSPQQCSYPTFSAPLTITITLAIMTLAPTISANTVALAMDGYSRCSIRCVEEYIETASNREENGSRLLLTSLFAVSRILPNLYL